MVLFLIDELELEVNAIEFLKVRFGDYLGHFGEVHRLMWGTLSPIKNMHHCLGLRDTTRGFDYIRGPEY
jgi:hypothetical protein